MTFANLTKLILAATLLPVGCATAPPLDIGWQPAEDSAELTAMARRAFDLVNEHRAARGLRVLKWDARIVPVARRHSAAMAQERRPFSHRHFQARAQEIRRFRPFSKCSENLALNYGHTDPAARALQSWHESASHREAMEAPFTHTAIAIAKSVVGKYYFTQIFVRAH
jgi:uncharacterized protein YkwD